MHTFTEPDSVVMLIHTGADGFVISAEAPSADSSQVLNRFLLRKMCTHPEQPYMRENDYG